MRPKLMTVIATTAGGLPLLWSQGAGADVVKCIATRMVGKLVTSAVLALSVDPALLAIWKRRWLQALAC